MPLALALLASTFINASSFIADDKELEKYTFNLKAVDIKKDDSALTKLQKERYNAAIDCAADEMLRIEAGRSTILALSEAVDMMTIAGLDLFTDAKERLAVLEESVRFAKYAEKIAEIRFESGAVPKSDVQKAKFIRLTAEIRVAREKAKRS